MKYVLLAVAALVITPAFAQSDASREFLKEAIQGDNAEIQMGQLAAARGGSKDVRDFGKMLSRDHQKAAAQAMEDPQTVAKPVQPSIEASARAPGIRPRMARARPNRLLVMPE